MTEINHMLEPTEALAFTPAAIRERFEGEDDPVAQWITKAPDAELGEVGYYAMAYRRLHRVVYDVLRAEAIAHGALAGHPDANHLQIAAIHKQPVIAFCDEASQLLEDRLQHFNGLGAEVTLRGKQGAWHPLPFTATIGATTISDSGLLQLTLTPWPAPDQEPGPDTPTVTVDVYGELESLLIV